MPSRIEYEDATCHVMARGNRSLPIVFSDADRELFTETMAETWALAKFKACAWGLMDNHYHWGLKMPKASVVEGMTWEIGAGNQLPISTSEMPLLPE